MPIDIIYGLAHVKRAAALTHEASGALQTDIADAIISTADAILMGKDNTQFPLVIWQTGSGTQSNMNVNEVMAGIANEMLKDTRGGKSPLHPIDDVNMGQSSNDSFPTALHVAVALAVHHGHLPAIVRLTDALSAKCAVWGDIIKIGRTHLQEATPLTLGQEFFRRCRTIDSLPSADRRDGGT